MNQWFLKFEIPNTTCL